MRISPSNNKMTVIDVPFTTSISSNNHIVFGTRMEVEKSRLDYLSSKMVGNDVKKGYLPEGINLILTTKASKARNKDLFDMHDEITLQMVLLNVHAFQSIVALCVDLFTTTAVNVDSLVRNKTNVHPSFAIELLNQLQ